MTNELVNIPENVKTILKTNWDLQDRLDKEKIQWLSYDVKDKQFLNEPFTIIVTNPSGVNPSDKDKNSQKIRYMDDLVKIDVWVKLEAELGDKERLVYETMRTDMVSEIFDIIHDNQTGITGIKFGKFSRWQRLDELNEAGRLFLHTIIWCNAEWYHTKT